MPSWGDVVNTWQQKNSEALNAYGARYKKAQAAGAADPYAQAQAGATGAPGYAFTDPDVIELQAGKQPISAQGRAAVAATAVKQTAPSPSPANSPATPAPNSSLQASKDLGAALSGQPQDDYATQQKKKRALGGLSTSTGGFVNNKLQSNGMVA